MVLSFTIVTALGTGQMSHAAAPGDWLGAVAVHLIKHKLPAVSLIPLINDCVDCLVVKTGFAHENQCCSFGRRFQHVLLFLYIHFKGLTNITLEKPLYFKLCIWL